MAIDRIGDVNLPQRSFVVSGFFLAVWPVSPAAYHAKPTNRIAGVVQDKAGAVISGASLSLFSSDKVRVAKAGIDGKFEFSELPFGTYELEGSSPGFRVNTVENIKLGVADVSPISIILQIESNPCGNTRPTASYVEQSGKTSLVGYVSDFWNGSGPVSDATVTVKFMGAGQANTATAGKRGDFQFVGLKPGKYTLRVGKPGYIEQTEIPFWIAAENLTKFTNIYIFKESETRKIICQ
jgi:carboxypeptidase family protein